MSDQNNGISFGSLPISRIIGRMDVLIINMIVNTNLMIVIKGNHKNVNKKNNFEHIDLPFYCLDGTDVDKEFYSNR